jgi:type VI secretion system FHA domain protein
MTLTLSILRCPDSAVPEMRQVGGGDYRIGRGPENDWVLPDPNRLLSKNHCAVEFRGGFWQVRDLSTNGTFLNAAADPIGRDQVRPLSDGDRLRIGPFEIEARIAADVAQGAYVPQPVQPYAMPGPYGSAYGQQGSSAWVPPADPFRDPMAPPSAGADIFSAPLPGLGPATPTATSQGMAGPLLPADFDPLAEPLPMPDHAPMTSDAFLMPKPASGPAPFPDDWDLGAAPAGAVPDPFAGLPDPFADAPPPGPSAQRPAAPLRPEPVPFPDLPDPFAEAPLPGAPAMPPATRPVGVPVAGAVPAAAPPSAARRPEPEIAPAGDASAALDAFLAGAGIRLPPGTDPTAALQAAGTAFRAAIAGMRALLIARSDVKREFRIEQTMLRAVGNNPVKFAATDEAAMAALLTLPNGPAAVAETADDLTAHQIATIAATQAAARALLDRLDPKPLEAADTAGGMFGAREKRLWDAYCKLHASVLTQFDDDFDSAFGKAFARAYEKAARRG